MENISYGLHWLSGAASINQDQICTNDGVRNEYFAFHDMVLTYLMTWNLFTNWLHKQRQTTVRKQIGKAKPVEQPFKKLLGLMQNLQNECPLYVTTLMEANLIIGREVDEYNRKVWISVLLPHTYIVWNNIYLKGEIRHTSFICCLILSAFSDKTLISNYTQT